MVEMLLQIIELPPDQRDIHYMRGLNPTPGILNSLADSIVSGIMMLRTGEGDGEGFVLVVTQDAAHEMLEVPPGTIVLGTPPEDHCSASGARPVLP